ncbi:MAG: pyrroline-5-carboxylate reductase [Prochlorococcaceae cyanobacterium ETNP1_MAG_9]|nr:pyrroline-5-carboxylate reductase [Prochlorococcaceae cyanobacterium ETNP1_MAG_9]
MPCSLGVIGLGRMAQAILLPLFERGELNPSEVFGVVGHQKSIQQVKDQLPRGVKVFSANDPISIEVWEAPVTLLAVKPQQLEKVEQAWSQIKTPDFSSRPLLISLLAGVQLERLANIFPRHVCVRAVPNTPVLVRAGLTGLACSENLDSDQQLWLNKIFDPISEVLNLPEEQLDAFLALTSSGPAYIALMAEALADGAVAAGLPRSMAQHLACRTLFGTSLLLKEKDLHPSQLKDMVASPGGTTITALRHLEKAGIRSALMEAVVVAAERSRELAELS